MPFLIEPGSLQAKHHIYIAIFTSILPFSYTLLIKWGVGGEVAFFIISVLIFCCGPILLFYRVGSLVSGRLRRCSPGGGVWFCGIWGVCGVYGGVFGVNSGFLLGESISSSARGPVFGLL